MRDNKNKSEQNDDHQNEDSGDDDAKERLRLCFIAMSLLLYILAIERE